MSPAFEPPVTPMATPRAMTHEGPLPYGKPSWYHESQHACFRSLDCAPYGSNTVSEGPEDQIITVRSFVRPDWTGGDEDLEKAIQQAQREKDTKAWKVLIQARTVRNNVAKVRA